MSVIELKVLHDVPYDSYGDVHVNCKIGLFEEIQEYKPPSAHWIVFGRSLSRVCDNVFGQLYTLKRCG